MEHNELKDRLRSLRLAKGMTQEQFARVIGIKRNSYANYEIGRNHPIDAVIHSICREFDVNETWLRTGEGDMFRATTDQEKITKWAGDVFADESDTFRQRFALMLSQLQPEQWERIEHYARILVLGDEGRDEKK